MVHLENGLTIHLVVYLVVEVCSIEKESVTPPLPKYGGKDCDGPTRENRTCEETDCPGNLRTFR